MTETILETLSRITWDDMSKSLIIFGSILAVIAVFKIIDMEIEWQKRKKRREERKNETYY